MKPTCAEGCWLLSLIPTTVQHWVAWGARLGVHLRSLLNYCHLSTNLRRSSRRSSRLAPDVTPDDHTTRGHLATECLLYMYAWWMVPDSLALYKELMLEVQSQ